MKVDLFSPFPLILSVPERVEARLDLFALFLLSLSLRDLYPLG